jgi:hypothetical protein
MKPLERIKQTFGPAAIVDRPATSLETIKLGVMSPCPRWDSRSCRPGSHPSSHTSMVLHHRRSRSPAIAPHFQVGERPLSTGSTRLFPHKSAVHVSARMLGRSGFAAEVAMIPASLPRPDSLPLGAGGAADRRMFPRTRVAKKPT